MKKAMAVLTASVLLIALAGAAMASSLDALKTTLELGPFQFKELGGLIRNQTDTTIETISGFYGLQTLDDPGADDAETASALAEKITKSGVEAKTYENKNGLQGLYYIDTTGGSKLLTMMFFHGSDCLISVSSQSPDIDLEDFYVKYLMDDYALIP